MDTHTDMQSLNRVQDVPVNQDNSQDGRSHVDSTDNGSVQKSRVGTVAQDIKQLSGVEHDGVDTGELLEEGDEDSTSLQRPTQRHEYSVLPLHAKSRDAGELHAY